MLGFRVAGRRRRLVANGRLDVFLVVTLILVGNIFGRRSRSLGVRGIGG
jgi:hypothetical protein